MATVPAIEDAGPPERYAGSGARYAAVVVGLGVVAAAVAALAGGFGALGPGFRALAIEQALLATLVVVIVWSPRRTIDALDAAFRDAAEHRPGAVGVLLVGLPIAWAWLTTPQITFGEGLHGGGYGHDGLFYGAIAERLGEPGLRVDPPFHLRLLAPALVRASGLDTFTGFRVLAVLGAVGTAWFTFRIGRALGGSRAASLLVVALVVGAKQGIKTWLHAPVNADPLGTALGLAAVDAVLRHRPGRFAVALGLGLFCRENLLFVLPFQWLWLVRHRRDVGARGALMAVLAGLLAAAPYVANRLDPVVPPTRPFLAWFTFKVWTERILFVPGRQQMMAYGYLNALGVLAFGLLAEARRGTRWLVREAPEHGWLLLSLAILGPLFGADYDRFALWTLPAFVAVWVGAGLGERAFGRAALGLVAIQLVSGEVPVPWATDELFSLGRNAAHPVEGSFTEITLSVWGAGAAFAIVWGARGDRIPTNENTAPRPPTVDVAERDP